MIKRHPHLPDIFRTGIALIIAAIFVSKCNLPTDPASIPPSELTYDTSSFSIYINELFLEITPRIKKGIVDSFTISPPLPEGLLFDSKKGTITGTPKTVSPTTDYQIKAVNKNGEAETIISLEIIALPCFTVQPQDVAVTVGKTVVFTAEASGKEPLSYRWTKDNAGIVEADSVSLLFTEIGPSDAGIYRCVVTDIHGRTIASDPARLVISTDTTPPRIAVPPSTRSAVAGEKVVLTVSAEGTDLVYQWLKDGRALPVTAIPYLQINSFSVGDTGTYRVIVSNDFGSDSSEPVVLSIATTSSVRYDIIVVINGNGRVKYNNLFISTDSTLQVAEGSTFAVRFLPDSGFIVKKVTIDDSPDSTAQTDRLYLFSKVATGHTVVVLFDTGTTETMSPDSFSCIIKVNDSTAGTVDIRPDRPKFEEGDTVTVTALPEIGYTFTSWEDSPGDSTNPRVIVIRSDLRIIANFAATAGIEEWAVATGRSLNALIAQVSGSPIPGAIIKPEPGEYDEGTVVVEGTLEVEVRRR